MNTLKIVIVSLVVIAFSVGLSMVFDKDVTVDKVDNGKPVGALSGPDIPYQYIRVGGVYEWFQHQTLATKTDIACTLKSPVATSTLVFASVQFDTSSSSATSWIWSSATTATATTTSIGTAFAIGANAQAYITASTTPAANMQFAPSTYLNLGLTTGSVGYGKLVPTGACSAKWIQAQ